MYEIDFKIGLLHYGQGSGQADFTCILGDPRNAGGVYYRPTFVKK